PIMSYVLCVWLLRYHISACVVVYIAVGLVSVVLSITGVFSKIISLVPSGITNGILAGILLPICLRAASASEDIPLMALVMLLVFLIARRLAPLFAVPSAMLAGIATLVITGGASGSSSIAQQGILAQPVWLTPGLDIGAMVSIGIPLLLVTMAGQNLPG